MDTAKIVVSVAIFALCSVLFFVDGNVLMGHVVGVPTAFVSAGTFIGWLIRRHESKQEGGGNARNL